MRFIYIYVFIRKLIPIKNIKYKFLSIVDKLNHNKTY